MRSNLLINLLKLLIVIFSITLVSCTQQVGESCDDDRDCDTNLICERSYPGGYCLQYSCDQNNEDSCPSEAQCTYFQDENSTYCLQKCNTHDDCRHDYSCQGVGNNIYRVCLPRKK